MLIHFYAEDGKSHVGGVYGTNMEHAPRVGDEVDLRNGYDSRDDIQGRVIAVRWRRWNINDKVEVRVLLAPLDN